MLLWLWVVCLLLARGTHVGFFHEMLFLARYVCLYICSYPILRFFVYMQLLTYALTMYILIWSHITFVRP
jgi:hypothetical protein